MPEIELAAQIVTLLDELNQQLTRLYDYLQQENAAITANNLEQVAELAQKKEIATAAIEHCELQRRKLLDQYQLGYDIQSMAQLARQCPRAQVREIASMWQAIGNRGQQCKELNQINGVVLAHIQRRAIATLRILRGQTSQAELYSARGNTLIGLDQHSLARI